jgi:hypothetical protein
LFLLASRLHQQHPDDPLPDDALPEHDRPDLPSKQRKAALLAAVHDFSTAQDLHDACTRLSIERRDVRGLKIDRPPKLLAAARWLIENGTDRRAVLLGLGLLQGHALPADVPVLKIVGLLRPFGSLVAEILAALPDAAHDLIWLVERTRGRAEWIAAQELAGHPDPAVRSWVRSRPRDILSSELARKIAERHQLLDLLDEPDDLLWDQTANLLLAMTHPRNYAYEITDYPDALAVYQRWVALAASRPPTVDRAALLVSVAQDLATGPAALVAGAAREELLRTIREVLGSWALSPRDLLEERRAAWIATQPLDVPAGRFAVRVVVPDPNPVGFPQVETRIMIDGVPIVAAAFDMGGAEDPDCLLDNGRLRATEEPQEVRLAEAYCTEGCCGGLYVTIVREGDEVVWRDWRSSMKGDPPGEFRFNASEYDREIARAEQDHGWEWPARTVSRLLMSEFREDPALLTRWDCKPGWCAAWLKEYDTVRLTFGHPAHRDSFDDPFVQFGVILEVGERPPATVAAEFVESLRHVDPKTAADVVGGRDVESLGFEYRQDRW